MVTFAVTTRVFSVKEAGYMEVAPVNRVAGPRYYISMIIKVT